MPSPFGIVPCQKAKALSPYDTHDFDTSSSHYRLKGDYHRANHLLETRLAIGREMGDRQGIANALNRLDIVACQQACWGKAHHLYLESLAIWQEIGYKQGVAIVTLKDCAKSHRATIKATPTRPILWFYDDQDLILNGG